MAATIEGSLTRERSHSKLAPPPSACVKRRRGVTDMGAYAGTSTWSTFELPTPSSQRHTRPTTTVSPPRAEQLARALVLDNVRDLIDAYNITKSDARS